MSTLNEYAEHCHAATLARWQDLETGRPIDRNKGELLCLIHSEISECMEGERKGLMDDHLPHRSMLEVELADAMIRIMDIAASRKLDLGGAIVEKIAYNRKRADHQPGARAEAHGKKF